MNPQKIIWFGVFLLLTGGAQAQSRPIPVDGYAAIVNDRIIMVSDVMSAVRPLDQDLRESYTPASMRARMREAYQEALDEVVARSLILEEFEAKEGTLPDRVINDHMNEVIRERFNNDRMQLLKLLTEQQLTLEEWREQIKDQLIVMILRRQEVGDRVTISPLDVKRRYTERLELYRVPEQVRLRMISLNKGETPEEQEVKLKQAKTLRERIIFGESFAALARQFSEGSKGTRGGDWGWIAPEDLREELTEVARLLEPGKVSDVVETEDHFYLVLVEARRAESTVSLDDVREELESELRQEAYNSIFDAWIDGLKQKHYVKTF